MDQMEKKQITNSSTVSSAVKEAHGHWGREPPCAWKLASPASLTHPSVELLPQKGYNFVSFP